MTQPTESTTAAVVDEAAPRLDPALEIPPAGSLPARREPAAAAPIPAAPKALGILKPIAPIAEIIEQQNALRQFIKQALVKDRDYGEIPGIDKPTLLKPGAERINAAYGVIARFSIVEREIDHDRENKWRKEKRVYDRGTWTGETQTIEGLSYGLYRFVILCELVHRETGIVVGSCVGSCSTLESKYIDRPRDVENTIIKMGEKRAYIGATVLAYGLSDEFTQDVEDNPAAFTGDAGNGEAGGPPKIEAPICTVHKVPMKDQRARKKNPRAPDWKCTQHELRGGVKVWCEEKKWPGEWPPKSADADPQTPAEQKSNATSSAGSAEPRSDDGTASSSSSGREASTPDTKPTPAKSPDSSTNSATATSSDSAATIGATSTNEPITRETVIEWATGRFAVVQGKRLKDLKYEQLDYFQRNRPAVLPPGWLEAIGKEKVLREDTGGDERDEAHGEAYEPDPRDPYNG